jgi:hypothetical protein
MATLRDLDEHYGIRDLYDMLEVLFVDSHNQRVVTDGQNRH